MMAYQRQARGHQNTARSERGMGYNKIKELSASSPEIILNTISNRHSGFDRVLKRESLRPDWISYILQISAIACKYSLEPLNGYSGLRVTSGNVNTSTLPSARLMTHLNDVRTSNFLMQCLPFVSGFLTETKPVRRRNICQDARNILLLCKTMLIVMPNSLQQVMPVVCTVDMVIRSLRSTNGLIGDDDELDSILEEANHQCDEVMKNQSAARETNQEAMQRNQQDQVASFRELPIFPSSADLIMQDSTLPRIKEHGRYDSVEQYLDTHFRLLREDFMRPLRHGIRDYLTTANKTAKLQNVRIYQDVHILHPVCTSEGICYSVSFDATRLHGVHWEHTKRLIYGALVCLSPDSFKTAYFATVSHREPGQLRNGIVELRFQNGDQEVREIGTDEKLVMAESSAYFEAYRYVLEGLKYLNEDNLPFCRYFVNCENAIHSPDYLRQHAKPRYNLQELSRQMSSPVDEYDDLVHRERLNNTGDVAILQKRSWPSADMVGLDESQLEAFRLALTKELAVIQGPPGTGKTFIGFRIVWALLQNDHYWKPDNEDEDNNSPILLICYTNHALDQFLEGITEFLQSGIVRVGGRSKSDVLERFLLRELRKDIREKKNIPIDVHRNRMDAMDECDRIRSEIEQCVADIEVSTKGFLQERCLGACMKDDHLEQLQNTAFRRQRESALSEWLGVDNRLAYRLYDEIAAQKQNNTETAAQGAKRAHENEENDSEEEYQAGDTENIEEFRVLYGDDDIQKITDEKRQKKIMAQALKNIAVKFSDLIVKRMQGHKEKADVTEEQKIKYLLDVDDTMSREEIELLEDVWTLGLKDRWRLYRNWLRQYQKSINDDLRKLEEEYELAARRLHEVKQRENFEIMKKAKILGMTTTAAARYRDLLHEIQPKIIIVEEAAEVLEAHILTALTRGCQHLILIGDHKQLRPTPTDYRIAEHCKLKISLFERLIVNGLQYETLTLQHRMPRNISKLLQHVYQQQLKDHSSCLDHSPLAGLMTNVYFIEHAIPETEIKDLQSKVNKHEAHFIVSLCKYLLLQGYRPTQITILTPYTGQLMIIRKLLIEKQLLHVRACAIDNFQGEENDLILVSLVRSNNESKIGFVGDDNRICVTLSRAKRGMILIGDAVLLSQMSSLWSKVFQTLRSDQCIGKALTLRCVNHPDQMIEASNARDFDGAPEGGCLQPCQARLKCGHACMRMCHAYDRDHQEYLCQKRCERKCRHGHPCRKKCYEDCGRCEQKVRKRMHECGHEQDISCYEAESNYRCHAPCSKMLPCGHRCQRKCGERCPQLCKHPVRRTLPCGHKAVMNCFQDPQEVVCQEKCGVFLMCEHKCPGTCGTCLEFRLHEPCTSPCQRILVCGHECKAACRQNCPPCSVKCQNRCAHSICQQQCRVPCIPCVEPCAWRCKHYKCTQKCHEPCNRPRCDRPCENKLPCGHDCIGLCGEPCPSKCRICDKDEVQEVFFGNEDEDDARFVELEDCGHIIEVSGLDQWMALADQSASSNGAVKLKCCPKCNVPIRRNLRYGSLIKNTLQIIEKVKEKILGHTVTGRDLKIRINNILHEISRLDPEGASIVEAKLHQKEGDIFAEEQAACTENVCRFLCQLGKLSNQIKTHITNITTAILKQRWATLLKSIKSFRLWILKERDELGQQEKDEAQMELSRLYLMAQTIECSIRIEQGRKPLPQAVEQKYQRAVDLLTVKEPFSSHNEDLVKNALKEVEKIIPRSGLGISDEERVQIVNAMGLSKGHWYHCPNGHVYCIGECGGAMERAKCPECNAVIGGVNHTLQQGNAVATEMDGARHAAWSDQANLENYDLDHLL